MKLAVFSDLHAHTFKDFDSVTDLTGSQRLDNIVSTLEYIRDDCYKRDIKHVLFAGDMFHIRSKVNTVVYNAIYDTIKSFKHFGIEIIAIAGNHDQNDNSDVPAHSLHTFNDLPGVTVYGNNNIHFLEHEGERVDIYCVPYSKNAQRTKDWIDSLDILTLNSHRICMFHLGIDGGFVGKGNYPMADAFKIEDLRPDFFKYIIGGHFHKHQFLGGHPHAFYTGAPIQHSFSDEGEDKGYFIIDTSKRYDVQFVPVPNPKFITMSATDVLNEDMMTIADAGHYVRLHVSEKDLQLVISHLPPHLQYKLVLEKVYEEVLRVDVKIGMSDEEVVTKYAEEYNPDAMEIGLKILAEVKGGI
jgi:DNA repair exonuclease SbcCD nuclease subunit